MDIREIADGSGRILDAALLAEAESLHRQLRPQLPPDYVTYMKLVLGHGVGMAVLLGEGRPKALAVWRAYHNTSKGHRLYVDDLVTDEAARSTGAGGEVLDWIEKKARAMGCDVLELDSGTQRTRAHRVYFRQGFAIGAFSFSKALKARV